MTECYEIDELKRKVEHAKMKLLTEIKVSCFFFFILLLFVLFSDLFTNCAVEETSCYRAESFKSRIGPKEESVVSSMVCDLLKLWKMEQSTHSELR